jgi:hypothetical protein
MRTDTYWQERWSKLPVDSLMGYEDVCPLKYTKESVSLCEGQIAEIGCEQDETL